MDELVDKVTRAVTSGDQNELRRIIELQTEPCEHEPQGPGAQPKCRSGEPEGTVVEGVWDLMCSGLFRRADQLDFSRAVSRQLVFKAAYTTDGLVGAKYILIFTTAGTPPTAPGGAIGYITDDEHVIAVHYGCAWSLDDFLKRKGVGTPVALPD